MKKFNEFLIEEGVFSDLVGAAKRITTQGASETLKAIGKGAKGAVKLTGKGLAAPFKLAASEVKNFGKDVKDAFLKPFERKGDKTEGKTEGKTETEGKDTPHSPAEIIDIIYKHYLDNPQLLETKTLKVGKVPFTLSDINSEDKEASQLLKPVAYTNKTKPYVGDKGLYNLQRSALDKIYSKSIDLDNIDKQILSLITAKAKEQATIEVVKDPKQQYYRQKQEYYDQRRGIK